MKLSLSNIKNRIRFWLLRNPKLNPYKLSFNFFPRRITSNLRTYPDFIIIGSGRAGTTSLYNYLIQHPNIMSSFSHRDQKVADLHFFEYMISNSTNWYRSHFPTKLSKRFREFRTNSPVISGEFTSTYMYHSFVPERIFNLIPSIKLIVILRNPVDKVYSAFSQQFQFKEFTSSFEEYIESEMKRIKIIENEPNFKTFNEDFESIAVPNILRHGIYHTYLKKWLDIFSKKQIYIVDSKDLHDNTQETLDNIFKFLEIPSSNISDTSKVNVGKYSKMDTSTRRGLLDFFSPHNDKLNNLLGTQFDWRD